MVSHARCMRGEWYSRMASNASRQVVSGGQDALQQGVSVAEGNELLRVAVRVPASLHGNGMGCQTQHCVALHGHSEKVGDAALCAHGAWCARCL
jgi:hypothetical protein